MVEEVECFTSKLQVDPFRYREALVNAEIEVPVVRTRKAFLRVMSVGNGHDVGVVRVPAPIELVAPALP
jgi:hypothetical protein